MKSVNKVSLLILAAALSSLAHAKVVELDAYNPDHCRQQLLKSADETPVIATYGSFYEDSESFLAQYEALAKQHPERIFFKWNQDADALHLSQSLCLQQLGVVMPASLMLMGIIHDDNSADSFMVNVRTDWAGQMSLEEMSRFVDISEPELKKTMSVQKKLWKK